MGECHLPAACFCFCLRCFADRPLRLPIVSCRAREQLLADKCPVTCENFKKLCTGEAGKIGSGASEINLTYKMNPFHNISKGFAMQAGNIVGNGSDARGGYSSFGAFYRLFRRMGFAARFENHRFDGSACQFRADSVLAFVCVTFFPWVLDVSRASVPR